MPNIERGESGVVQANSTAQQQWDSGWANTWAITHNWPRGVISPAPYNIATNVDTNDWSVATDFNASPPNVTVTVPVDAELEGEYSVFVMGADNTEIGNGSFNVVENAAEAKIPLSQKGAANGVATLDSSSKIPSIQLPALSITETFVVGSQAAMLALSAQQGDVAVRSDINQTFILSGSDPTVLANWTQLETPTGAVLSVNGQTGTVVLDAGDVGGLSTSDNLSDLASAATARTNLGLGTSSTLNVAASGNATAGQIVKGDDSRLTDARTPTGSAGGDLSGTYPNPALATTGVSSGSYTNANITVDDKGRVTAASNGSTSGGVTDVTATAPLSSSGGTTPNISLAAASQSSAGSMSASDKTKLDGIASGATVGISQTAADARYNQISNNLGDVANVVTSRTNLGLGSAAILDVASSGNAGTSEVVKGNDTRLTDSRTPSGNAGGDLTGTYPNPTLAVPPIPLSQKGAANGVATLDANTKIPTSQLPALAITETFVVNSQAAMLALAAQQGDVAVRTDLSQTFILAGADPSVLADWTQLATPSGGVVSINGQSGVVSLSAANVGALAVSNNFSDVANAGTARTNLGLGSASVLSVAASGNASNGEVVKGDDTRLSDNRTPTGAAGGDLTGTYPNPTLAVPPVPLSQKGAANGVATLDSGSKIPTGQLPSYVSSVNGQSGAVSLNAAGIGALAAANNLSDVASASTARTNLGLGSSSTLNAPASGDAASGEVVKGNDSRLTNNRTPSGSAGGDLTGTYPNPTLNNSGVSAGAYTNANITVDSKGRVTAAANGSSAVRQYILIQDQKAMGTYGGSATSGAWRTRDLNTEVVDTGNNASLSSNQVTLQAGTYEVRASAPALAVDRHQCRFYNVSDASVVALGSSEWSSENSLFAITHSIVVGRFTIASSKVFELQHRVSWSQAVEGWGQAAGFGTEIYSILELWKVA